MKCFIVILTALLIWITPSYTQISITQKPLDKTKVFLITDFGYSVRINGRNDEIHPNREKRIINSEFGIMNNFHSKWAIGVNVHMAFDVDRGFNIYTKFRVRRWFNEKVSLDFAPGVNLEEHKWLVSLDFNFNEWLGLTTQVNESTKYREFKYPVYMGMKIRSKPGLIFNGIGVPLAILFTALTLGT